MTKLSLQTILLAISLLPFIAGQSNHRPYCRKTCPPKNSPFTLPHAFGFSAACTIPLNCTPSGQILIGDYPVHSITSDTIIISVKSQCNRPFHTFHRLFTHNYAPTSRNAILLQNCKQSLAPCVIPATMVQTQFQSKNCNGKLSCYYENSTVDFMSLQNIRSKRCRYIMSAIAAEELRNNSDMSGGESGVSLEVETIELAWWLEGECECSKHANCTRLKSPTDQKPGYRCRCREGFSGDGYLAGSGCRKDSSSCNPTKYMSGQCGGTTRFVVLIGGMVFGASSMIGVGLICCFFRRRSKLRVTKSTKRRLNEATSNYSVPIYTYKDIERATNNFSEKQRLGTGAYGTVYAGKLLNNNNEWVAIKRIKYKDTDSIEKVMNEIKLISSVNHPNLVRLLGCSLEYGEQILVYEFMPNGTLNQHLLRERGMGLTWQVRLNIAVETAQAIAHLHSAIDPPIYHRDIKSSNILLDNNFRSKVADFGLSRPGMTEISHISTAPQGTPGYVDPQYHQDFHLSDKSDVYSFGVVLVEIITGLKVVDFTRPQNAVNLASFAIDKIGKGLLDEIIDPFLEACMDDWTHFSVHKTAELAFRCLAFHRDMRPSMIEVAAELEQIRMSRWTTFEDSNRMASTELSSSSPSSDESEKPLSVRGNKVETEGKGLKLLTGPATSNSVKKPKNCSPVSVHDPDFWLSEQSSLSSKSNSLSKSFEC